MINPVIIGNVIQKYRINREMSQEVLSSFADIGRTHLSAIERGERNPSLDTLFKIAYALHVKPSDLVMDIEDSIDSEEAFDPK